MKRITRTIKSTEAVVLCVDTTNGETANQTFCLAGTYKDEKKLLKECGKVAPSNVRPVYVVSKTEPTKRYAMTEETFIQYATPIEK